MHDIAPLLALSVAWILTVELGGTMNSYILGCKPILLIRTTNFSTNNAWPSISII